MTDSTARAQDAAGDEAQSARQGSSAIRLAVVDSDSGFLQVLTKRLEGVGWQYRVLASPVPLDTVVAMRLNAIVIDLAALGPQAWSYLERLCSMLPGLGVVVCTGQYAMAHGDRSVDVFVRKLRQKLERSSPGWRYIHTHFGIGYRFAPEAVDGVADHEAVTAVPEPALGDQAGAADTELVS